MNKSPAFQFYAQDFLTGVMYLTNEEKGIYITMIAKQWTDGKIPKKRLGFLVGSDWDKLSEELQSKFEDRGDCVVNIRLEKEREKQKSYLEKQRLNGKKGGRPSKKNDLEKPKANPKKPMKKKMKIEDEVENENEKVVEISVWPDFEDFWELYDKKIGSKKKLKPKWQKLNQETKELIMAYVSEYKKSQPDKTYRKNPETFLNNESWNDELINKNQSGNNWKFDAEKVYNGETANNIKFT